MKGSNPREEWIARARRIVPRCDRDADDRHARSKCQPEAGIYCDLHEAVATGLAQSFYAGVRAGLEQPDKSPIARRLPLE